MDWVLAQVLPALEGKHVHISFDVDVLDPSEFTATGYNIPGGPSLAQVEQVLNAVTGTGQTVSFECVEYNPTRDPGGKDLRTLMGLLGRIAEQLR